ncbi:MAG TPA: hypothetical protein VF744_10225 [Beijerinckiaceae bacterium]|jgi:hypothetical protein
MARLSRVAGRFRRRAWRTVLPQIAISITGAVVATLMLSKVIAEHPAVTERAAPAVPVAQLWPRQTDPARLFSLSFDLAPAAAPAAVQTAIPASAPVVESKPQVVVAKAEPKAVQAKPRRPAVAVGGVDVLPPPRPASLAVAAAEVAPAEPAESPRLFGVKLPGSIARVGGTVATTVASLGERLWDQLP